MSKWTALVLLSILGFVTVEQAIRAKQPNLLIFIPVFIAVAVGVTRRSNWLFPVVLTLAYLNIAGWLVALITTSAASLELSHPFELAIQLVPGTLGLMLWLVLAWSCHSIKNLEGPPEP